MITKFTKIGDEWGLIFDPAILELFNIDVNTQFEVTAKDGRLYIRPIGHEIPQDQFEAALAEVNRKHGTTLQRLAE